MRAADTVTLRILENPENCTKDFLQQVGIWKDIFWSNSLEDFPLHGFFPNCEISHAVIKESSLCLWIHFFPRLYMTCLCEGWLFREVTCCLVISCGVCGRYKGQNTLQFVWCREVISTTCAFWAPVTQSSCLRSTHVFLQSEIWSKA